MALPPRRWPEIALGLLLAAHAGIAAARVLAWPVAWSVDGTAGSTLLQPLSDGARGLVGLLALAAVGRVLLSLLPSGPIGSHAPRDLPSTWAVSHLLGLLGLQLQGALLGRLEVTSTWAVWTPWVLLGVLRLATLPGALVPGHEPARERPPRGVGAIRLGLLLWTLLLVGFGFGVEGPATAGAFDAAGRSMGGLGFPPEGMLAVLLPFSWLAAWLLLAEGLERARRAPQGSAIAVAAVALFVVHLPDRSLSLVYLGGGLALLIPWLRRADRRALALSAVFFGACAAGGMGWISIAGAFATVAGGRAGQRPEALRTSALALLLVALPGALLFEGRTPEGTPGGLFSQLASAPGLVWLALVGGTAATLLLQPREREELAPPRDGDLSGQVAPPSLEIRACLLWIVAGTLLVGPWSSAFGSGATAAHLFPAAALLVGLSTLRSERPTG